MHQIAKELSRSEERERGLVPASVFDAVRVAARGHLLKLGIDGGCGALIGGAGIDLYAAIGANSDL